MGEGKDRSFMEIGSIYEISPDAAAGTDREAALPPLRLKEVEKYGKKYCRFTGSGREAIALALRSLEADRPGLNKCCLLPAYMCDSVFSLSCGQAGGFIFIIWMRSWQRIRKAWEARWSI